MKNEISVERIFSAPIELVWKIWTENEHIEKWMGPKGFSCKVPQNEFKAGGKYKYVLIGPDGKEYPSVGVYKEIKEKELIVATDDFGDELKKSMDNIPEGMITKTYFEKMNGKTKIRIVMEHPNEEEKMKHEKMGVVAGWNSTFDCLEEYLTLLT